MNIEYYFLLLIEGDDVKNDDPKQAIELFEKVVELETKVGDQVKW